MGFNSAFKGLIPFNASYSWHEKKMQKNALAMKQQERPLK